MPGTPAAGAAHAGPRGRSGEAPWLGLAPTSVLPHLGHWEPLLPPVFPSLQRASHPRMAPAPAANHSLDERQAWITGQQERAGGTGVGRWPILPLLQEPRDKGAGTERPAAHPAALPTAASRTGFTSLPQRRELSIHIGSGRERLEKASPTSGGNCCSVQDGPGASTRLGAGPPALPPV